MWYSILSCMRVLGTTSWERILGCHSVSQKRVWKFRFAEAAQVFVVTPFYFIFVWSILESKTAIRGSYCTVFWGRIFVSTKTSCYRFYFECLLVYLAVLSGTSQVAELCRTHWNVHPGVFVASGGHRAALAHLQGINKATIGSWIHELALLWNVSNTNHAPSDCCEL